MPALHHHSGVAASSFGLLTSYLRSTRPLASAACAGLSTCDSSREPDFAHWLIVACAGFVTGSVVSACTADLPLTSACAKPAQTLQRFEEWAEAIGSDLALVTVTNWQQVSGALCTGQHCVVCLNGKQIHEADHRYCLLLIISSETWMWTVTGSKKPRAGPFLKD